MKQILFVMFAGVAFAAAPAGFGHWTSQQLDDFQKSSTGKGLGKYGNHSIGMSHRDKSGEAELHETQNDIFLIRSGEADLIVGGAIPGRKQSAPNEFRGPKIEGGEKQHIAPGDIVHVPAGVPHQMLLAPGTTIDYVAIKVDAGK